MYRYYPLLIKSFPCEQILHSYKKGVYHTFKKINFCSVHRNLHYSDERIHQVSLLAPLNLYCKTNSSIIRCFSQGISNAKGVTKEEFNNTSGESLKPSNHTEVTVDADIDNHSSGQEVSNTSNLFENVDFDAITGGDEEKMNRLKYLLLEVDVMRQDGMPVPSKMSTEQWKELFSKPTWSQKRKFLNFLFKTEMKKLSDLRKKELKRIAKERSKEENPETSSESPKYGFQGSTIFIRIYDTTINSHDNHKLIQAMRFGQDLVIDCGFYNDMNQMENKLCCKQLVYVFAENRMAKNPFNIHFCNLKKDSYLYDLMKKGIPTLEDPGFPINIHEDHYLQLFPKEKMVYLTPHCRTELKEFNPDDIYIIGAIVDRVNQNPLTLAKAKSEGLRMAQLPLDRYLHWAIGNKSLTVNQVVNIMHDLQVTGNWDVALKHVPKRKIHQPNEFVKDKRKFKSRFRN